MSSMRATPNRDVSPPVANEKFTISFVHFLLVLFHSAHFYASVYKHKGSGI